MKIKKLIYSFFLSKYFLTIFVHIRIIPLLWILKELPPSKFKTLLSDIFDPNNIRKSIKHKFHEKLVKIALKDGGVFIVDVNEHLGYKFYINREFDSTILRLAEILGVSTGSILLDIGANIGSVSIPFAKKYDIEVIAIEASPKNASLLLKNISLNRTRFTVYSVCAVSPETQSKSDFVEIFAKNGNSAANSMYQNWNKSLIQQELEFSRTATVDQILRDRDLKRIKLIKIDVEGAEEEVLKGFTSINKTNAPIVFEYRVDVLQRDLSQSGNGLVAELEKSFKLFGIQDDRSQLSLVEFDSNTPAANAIGLPLHNWRDYLSKFDIS